MTRAAEEEEEVMLASSPELVTVLMTVTRELERTFSKAELEEAGGLPSVYDQMKMECAQHGTIVECVSTKR